MQFSSILVLAAAGFVAAQTATGGYASSTPAPGSTGCSHAVNFIVDQCLFTESPKERACAGNDWDCLCNAQQAIVTCFNNCPSDPRAVGALQNKKTWCREARAYPSTSTRVAKSTTAAPKKTDTSNTRGGSSSSGHSESGEGDEGDSDSGKGKGSGSGSSGAGSIGAPLAGLGAAVLGAVALL